jgi:hypothetical protein
LTAMSRRLLIILGLVLVTARVLMLMAMLSLLPERSAGTDALGNDATRFHEIATASGRPYRDFEVEVPPVELGAIELIDGSTSRGTAFRLAWSMLVVDILVAAALVAGWGVMAGFFYLVIGSPLALFIYFRLDLLSVLLAVTGLALIRRGRARSGGLAVALAVLTKLWPVVLIPLLIVRKSYRALAWCSATLVLGVGGWIAWAGIGGPVQVVTFRHARGWEVGSLPGSLIRLFFAATPTNDAGAVRVGYAPLWARLIALALLLLILRVIWLDAAKATRPVEEVAVLTSVAALLALSPILSEQYVVWLVPWAAAAAAAGQRRVELPTFLVTGVTALSLVVPGGLGGASQSALWYGFLLIRDVLIVVVMIDGLRRLARSASSVRSGLEVPLDLSRPRP